MAAILKIQNGGHHGAPANAINHFRTPDILIYPAMYSFATLQRNPTTLHSEPHYVGHFASKQIQLKKHNFKQYFFSRYIGPMSARPKNADIVMFTFFGK